MSWKVFALCSTAALALVMFAWGVREVDLGILRTHQADSLGDANEALCVLAHLPHAPMPVDEVVRIASEHVRFPEDLVEIDGRISLGLGLTGWVENGLVVRYELPEEIECFGGEAQESSRASDVGRH